MGTNRGWTQPERAELVRLWDEYPHNREGREAIGALLGRSERSINYEIGRLGLARLADGKGVLNSHHIADLLGVKPTTVIMWIRSGAFGDRLPPARGRNNYRLPVDELWTWMTEPASWHLWRPENVTDLAMREHFTELRRDWITSDEAAKVLHLSAWHVHRLAHDGKLAAMKPTPRAFWFCRQEVEEYRLRTQQPGIERELAALRSEVAWLRQQLERQGILAVGFPVRARYAGAENR